MTEKPLTQGSIFSDPVQDGGVPVGCGHVTRPWNRCEQMFNCRREIFVTDGRASVVTARLKFQQLLI